MSDTRPAQLPLAVGLSSRASFENFVVGANREAIVAVEAQCSGTTQGLLYLWGSSGTGKSHLLEAACRQITEIQEAAAYLPLHQADAWGPGILSGLSSLRLVCLDGLERVAGQADWEEALFHFLNQAEAAGTRIIAAARLAPTALDCGLPDLASRLAAGLVIRLSVLDDAERSTLLQAHARERGFSLSPEVAQYLLRRQSRDLHALLALLDSVDRNSLAAQRRVTIPFLREMLED